MIKIGVIGLGYWGPNILRNFSSIKEVNVPYACDIDSEAIDKISHQYRQVKFVNDPEVVISSDEVDAVAIATPVSTHYELAKKALNSGKHVLLEKPMASSVKHCEELIKIAEDKNLVLMVDHPFIYTGAVKEIKNSINLKEFGKPRYFDSERINLGIINQEHNVLWDLAPHDLSIISYLFPDEEVKSVFAYGSRYVNSKTDEVAHLIIGYKSGLVAHIHVSWLSPLKIRKIIIGCEDKMIYFDDVVQDEKVKIYDKGAYVDLDSVTPQIPLYRSGDAHIPKIDNTEALRSVCLDFVRSIDTSVKPISSGNMGRNVVSILELADKSLKEGRVISI